MSRAKRTDSLYYLNAVACENSTKDENPIFIGTEKVTEKIFLWKGAETTECELTLNRLVRKQRHEAALVNTGMNTHIKADVLLC